MSETVEKEPFVSIITITYNAAGEIEPTVKSVAEQSCRDFEHIIIDGASTDDTLSTAHKAARHELRILSERDNGLYDAMNKGLRMARGRYLLFLNAGDTFHSKETLRLYKEGSRLADGKGADIIYGDTVVVDRGRNVIGPRHLSVPERLTYESFSRGMLVCHQAFMVRRKLAPEYDTSYRFSADYDWTLFCLRRSSADRNVNLHTVTIDYLSDGLTDKNHRASLMERFDIMRRHFGLGTTLLRHAEFVPRAILRKFSRKG